MKKLVSYFLVAFLFLAISADAKEKQGKEEGTGSSNKSSGVNTGVAPEQPGQFGVESSSCTWWWLTGQHSWSWSGIPYLYISWNSYGKTWTEYGTSTGPCSGVPLIVDRIYVRVVEYPRGSAYADYDNTAYNTNFVDRGNSGWCAGCPNLCGVWSYHEATKSGITWSAQARSGCV